MTYPATFDVETPDKIDNWRPLVQWFLAIPHLILLNALESLAAAVALISWFAIVFTGKLPSGLADLQVMILRYGLRVEAYAGFLHEAYPPFEFSTIGVDPGDTPTTASYTPVLEDRDRLTVGLRILWLIPALLYVIAIGIVGIVAHLLSVFAVLFTGRWPLGLRRWVLKSFRVSNRFSAYAFLLTDEYPPFNTD